jgi:uncharacterized membrane protein
MIGPHELQHMPSVAEVESRETDRLKAFSDGVIAIAITLLAIEITVPVVPPGDSVGVLPGLVAEQWPDFFAFALSFFVIGLYWTLHRRVFMYLDRHSKPILWLNLVFLLFVAFLPYASSMFSRYPGRFGVVFYAGVQVLTGLSLAVLWAYSMRKSLFKDGVPTAVARIQGARFVGTPLVFLLSIPIAFVSPTLATLGWLLLLPVNAAAEVRLRGAAGAQPDETAS